MSMRWYRLLAPGCLLLVLPLIGCPSRQSTAVKQPPQAVAPPAPAPVPAPAAAPTQPSAEQQRVASLIAQVEAAYARGDADYRKGRLADAKTEFDHAVDLMLQSGIDIESDARLHDEFDQIVDKVNGLEMEALKQGNGFVPAEEQTPAEAASDVTFAVDPNLVAKARAELATTKSDLPLMVNEYVASFINFFAYTEKGHYTLLHALERAGRYKPMIQRILAEEGVPQDLIYLAVAESGFQPRAVNRRSRAGGMWQFMPRGNYGLERNLYVDERFDPEKSTRAYARYMKFLYDQLGDWYLAMAAYDHGAGNIQREVAKTGYADFWQLYKRHELPAETQNYVPEILAAIIIANNPHQYGFDDVTLDPPVLTDTVTVNYAINLRLVADLVGAPVDELQALNPSLLRMETPPDQPFDLRLPAGTAAVFDQRVALIPEDKRRSWRYHVLEANESAETVARAYHVSVAALVSANDLSGDRSLEGMHALVVPVPPQLEPSYRTRLYIVRRGDTLITIADRFGVSLSELRRWNRLGASIRLPAGRRLRVAEPVYRSRRAVHRRVSRRRAGSKPGRRPSTRRSPSKSSAASGSAPSNKASQR